MSKTLQLADCRTRDQYSKLFVRRVEEVAHRSRKVDVFRDFLAMASRAISNSMMFSEEREAEYMKIIGKYDKADAGAFGDLLAITVEALEVLRDDFLGHVYMSQEMGVSEAGQFFTPSCVADMMAKMTFGDGMRDLAAEKGYVTVNDPACGGGVQLIAAYKAAIEQGLNPSTQLCVYAEDIDSVCVHMTYVQLSLLGLPALVSHRNTISMETWAQWRTPVWWMNGFEYRERRRRDAGECIATSSEPAAPADMQPDADADLRMATQAELFAM